MDELLAQPLVRTARPAQRVSRRARAQRLPHRAGAPLGAGRGDTPPRTRPADPGGKQHWQHGPIQCVASMHSAARPQEKHEKKLSQEERQELELSARKQRQPGRPTVRNRFSSRLCRTSVVLPKANRRLAMRCMWTALKSLALARIPRTRTSKRFAKPSKSSIRKLPPGGRPTAYKVRCAASVLVVATSIQQTRGE